MKYSGSFLPQDYILYYYGKGRGTAEVPPLDDIDEIIADILGKTNVSISGASKSQDIISFLHEAVKQPHRYEFFFYFKKYCRSQMALPFIHSMRWVLGE